MSVFYIKFSPTNQPLEFVERAVPFEGFNTKADSAVNGKPYWVEATRVGFEPFDSATQVRTGPVLEASPPVIRWAIRAKTATELAAEQRSRDISVLQGAGKDAVLVLVELIDWQLANTTMQASDFTANVRQAFMGLKAIADRIK